MDQGHFQAICRDLSTRIRWISGKFFAVNKGMKEIKNIDKGISDYVKIRFSGMYTKPSEIEDIKSTIILDGDPVGRWPELPLVTMAREKGGMPYDISSLPFPLEKKQMIIIGRMLFHPFDAVIFITTGVGGSGKSTFLNLVRQLFDDDCANTSLTSLSNEFMVAEAVKHRLIASDEIGKGDNDEEMLKRLSAKNPMTINPKNKTPYEVMSQSSIFYCCNKEPVLDITDTGILRRIVYYRRDTPISNPVEGMDCQRFTDEQLMTVARQAYGIDGGVRGDGWKDNFLVETHKTLSANSSVFKYRNLAFYDQYRETCKENGLKPYSSPRWEEQRRMFDEWDEQDRKILVETEDLPF